MNVKIYIIFICCLLTCIVKAQTSQVVSNGSTIQPVVFAGSGCVYKWVNDNPSIGLAASGTGNIAAFTAINNGTTPITATITATPGVAGMAYITNNYSNSVSVVDLSNNTILTTIPVGYDPTCASVSPNTNSVYVSSSLNGGTVSVISTLTNTVTANISVGAYPFAVYASPDGSRVYAANYDDNTISVINTATNKVINTWSAGKGPLFMTSSNDGIFLYVNNYDFHINTPTTVTVINTTTGAIVKTIPVGAQPWGITKSADGKFVFVANEVSRSASVISTATNTVVSTIAVSGGAQGIDVSPDGTLLYIKDLNLNVLQVINVQSQAVIARIPMGGQATAGITVSPDGKRVVALSSLNSVATIIDAANNSVVANISMPGGESPGYGNCILGGNNCSPVTFTITVNPSPTIIAGNLTGSILSCEGTASTNPTQFPVTANNLTTGITATASANFEISSTPGSGYSKNILLAQTNGSVNTVVYVRSAANASAGNLSGNITLSAAGATTQSVSVSGIVNAVPKANIVANVNYKKDDITNAINFTGSADTYTWVNSDPSIGFPAAGTGNITGFKVINTGTTPSVATITVTPVNSTGCTGNPITFTITVNPLPNIVTGNLTGSIISCEGIASVSPGILQFPVTANSLTTDITVAAPVNFEVSSTPGSGYSKNILLAQTNGAVNTVVYVRSAANASAGNLAGNVTLSSTGVTAQLLAVSGIVNAVPNANVVANVNYKNGAITDAINFTGSADNYTWVNSNPSIGLTASGTGNITSFKAIITDTRPVVATITVTPVNSTGCTGNQVVFTITVNPLVIIPENLIIPNTFTPNGDGINDIWNIAKLSTYVNSLVKVFNRNGQVVFSSRGYSQPWDGRSNNHNVPDGVYYYLIDLNDGSEPAAGSVTIIR